MEKSPEFDEGTAGASARREGARRRANRERRVRERHPKLGGVILALQEEPQHERAWDRGGGGEESVQESLAQRCDPGVFVLHDRRIEGERSEQRKLRIDHAQRAMDWNN